MKKLVVWLVFAFSLLFNQVDLVWAVKCSFCEQELRNISVNFFRGYGFGCESPQCPQCGAKMEGSESALGLTVSEKGSESAFLNALDMDFGSPLNILSQLPKKVSHLVSEPAEFLGSPLGLGDFLMTHWERGDKKNELSKEGSDQDEDRSHLEGLPETYLAFMIGADPDERGPSQGPLFFAGHQQWNRRYSEVLCGEGGGRLFKLDEVVDQLKVSGGQLVPSLDESSCLSGRLSTQCFWLQDEAHLSGAPRSGDYHWAVRVTKTKESSKTGSPFEFSILVMSDVNQLDAICVRR